MSVCVNLVFQDNSLVVLRVKCNFVNFFSVHFMLVASDNVHRSTFWFFAKEVTLVVIKCDFLFDD